MEGADKDFANTFGNYILHGIEEVHLPEPISWWPQTIGWKLLVLLLLLLLSYRVVIQTKLWWHNRYRRVALKRLSELESSASGWQYVVRQLPFLLKTTALLAYPRVDVAQLSGKPWLRFLDSQYTGPAFSDGVGQELLAVSYKPNSLWMLSESEAQVLITMTRAWIREHKQAPHA